MSTIDDVQRIIARGHELPADLRLLVQATIDDEWVMFNDLGVEPIMPGEEHEIHDMTYLSEADLANPDIAANVTATREVLDRAVWVASDGDGASFGYWLDGRSPEDGLDGAPIVVYDSEGQFDIVPGATLAEACTYLHTWEDDGGSEPSWDECRTAVAEAGIAFSSETHDGLDDWAVEVSPHPSALHVGRYEELRAADRG